VASPIDRAQFSRRVQRILNCWSADLQPALQRRAVPGRHNAPRRLQPGTPWLWSLWNANLRSYGSRSKNEVDSGSRSVFHHAEAGSSFALDRLPATANTDVEN
jgi:hypothetical protein